MKLSEILPESGGGQSDIEISSISFNAAGVQKGALFFCLEGAKNDGHNFAAEAEKNGAAVIVALRRTDSSLPHIIVRDTRSSLSRACSRFFGEPAKQMKMIALTGTNGKTTTSYIIRSILEAAGKKTGVIGTNAIMIGQERTEAVLTTPDPTQLHSVLKTMLEKGVEYVVMEASAHALYLNKLDGIVFDAAAFTNLSRDHLDYFKNLGEYFAAKKKLFTKEHSKLAVINIDDEYGREIIKDCALPFVTYGCLNPAEVFAIDLSMSVDGLKYVLNINDDLADVRFSMPGKFNMYNTLCAAAVCSSLGIGLKDIINGIRSLTKVEGRFNIINTSKCSVIIDFAHTDDGLKNILSTIREFAPKKVITVFGCGGDRDRSKRPMMGKVVSSLSDCCFITSDNPRSEDPDSIINEIAAGIDEGFLERVFVDADRKSAILKAVEYAGDGDVVLIAGKGAEKYQDIQGIKVEYNDEEYILKLIEEKKI